jgi:hypothetical protein
VSLEKGEESLKEMAIKLQEEKTYDYMDIPFYLKKAFLVLFAIQATFWLSTVTPCAEENCWSIPTVTGEFVYPDGWFSRLQWDPTNPQTVDRDSSVTISVLNGEAGFSWEVGANDFWFDEEHTAVSITGDARSVTVYAGPDACGGAIISVTDIMGNTVTGSVRCTNGRWVLMHEEYCGEVTLEPGQCNCTNCSRVVVGAYMYEDCWWGGTRTYRYDGPYCSKWPATEDLSDTKCGCPGYYFPFDAVGLYDHRMWQWQCQ